MKTQLQPKFRSRRTVEKINTAPVSDDETVRMPLALSLSGWVSDESRATTSVGPIPERIAYGGAEVARRKRSGKTPSKEYEAVKMRASRRDVPMDEANAELVGAEIVARFEYHLCAHNSFRELATSLATLQADLDDVDVRFGGDGAALKKGLESLVIWCLAVDMGVSPQSELFELFWALHRSPGGRRRYDMIVAIGVEYNRAPLWDQVLGVYDEEQSHFSEGDEDDSNDIEAFDELMDEYRDWDWNLGFPGQRHSLVEDVPQIEWPAWWENESGQAQSAEVRRSELKVVGPSLFEPLVFVGFIVGWVLLTQPLLTALFWVSVSLAVIAQPSKVLGSGVPEIAVEWGVNEAATPNDLRGATTLVELLSQWGSNLGGDDVGKQIVNLMVLVISLARDPSRGNFGLQFVSFFNNSSLALSGEIRAFFISLAKELVGLAFSPENESGAADTISTGRALSSPLYAKARHLIGMFSLSAIVTQFDLCPQQLKGWWNVLEKSLSKGGDVGVFWFYMMDLVKEIFSRALDCVNSGSLRPLFAPEAWTVERWLSVSRNLIMDRRIRKDEAYDPSDFTKALAAGDIDSFFPQQLSVMERWHAGKILLDKADELEGQYRDLLLDPAVKIIFLRAKSDLAAHVGELSNAFTESAYRVQPLGVYVHGEPGCGKTTSVDAMFRAMSTSFSIPYTHQTVYSYVAGVNFQDGFSPSHQFMLFDDVDAMVIKEGTTNGNWAADLLHIVSNGQHVVEAAALESKGKNHVHVKGVVMVSNSESIKAKSLIKNAEALNRRFPIKIKAVANPLCASGVGSIVPEKAAELKARGLPPTLFTVSLLSHESERVGEYAVVEGMTDVSLIVLLKWLREYASKFYKQQLELVEMKNRSPVACRTCGIDIKDHDVPCVEVAAPGQNESLTSFQQQTLLLLAVAWFVIPVGTLLGMTFLWMYLVRWWPGHAAAIVRHARIVFDLFILRFIGLRNLLFYSFIVRTVGTDPYIRHAIRSREQSLLNGLKEKAPMFAAVVGLLIVVRAAADLLFKQSTPNTSAEGGSNEFLVGSVGPSFQVKNGLNFVSVKKGQLEHPIISDHLIEKSKTVNVGDVASQLASRLYTVERDGTVVKGLLISSQILHLPAHFFSPGTRDDGRLVVLPRSGAVELTISKELGGSVLKVVVPMDHVEKIPGADSVLVFIPGLPVVEKMLGFPPFSLEKRVVQSDVGWLVRVEEGRPMHVQMVVSPGLVRTSNLLSVESRARVRLRYEVQTSPGDCGSPIIAQFKNELWIVGFHNVRGSDMAYGEVFLGIELQQHSDNLRSRVGMPPPAVDLGQFSAQVLEFNTTGKNESGVLIGEIPEKRSSLKAALRTTEGLPVDVMGNLVGYRTSRMKSSIRPSRASAALRNGLVEWCDDPLEFAIPTFKGERVNGPAEWTDPFVVNLSAVRNENGDPRIWKLAVKDFLKGVDVIRESGDGIAVRPLSLDEALDGVPGLIKSVNVKTSMGPPFNRPKKHHMERRGDSWVVDDRVCNQIQEMLVLWHQGVMTPLVCSHTLKDEVISQAKAKAHGERVFNTVGTGPNLAAKMLMGPILSYMMAYPEFFECWGGANFTGPEVGAFVEWFAAGDWKERMLAGDFEKFDVRQCTEGMLAAAEVFRGVASVLNYTLEQQTAVYCCALSFVYTFRVINGDMFAMSSGNPSGGYITLGFNSVHNSLAFRYVYYKGRIEKGELLADLDRALDEGAEGFRSDVRLGTVGDDHVAATRLEWFDQLYVQSAMKEIGHSYTDALKRSRLERYTPLNEVSFLKRTFVFDDQLQLWRAPLARKSLGRMLLFTKKSEAGVSIDDQEAAIWDTALREAFLHGREAFDRLSSLLHRAQYECALPLSSMRWKSYEDLEKDFVAGKLLVWDSCVEVPWIETSGGVNESGVTPVDLGPILQADSATQVTHVATEVPFVEVGANSVGAKGDLKTVLERALVVGYGTIGNALTPGTEVFNINLLEEYFLAGGTARMAGYKLLRGDLEVEVELVANSLLKGMVVVSATPLKAGMGDKSLASPVIGPQLFNFANAFQSDLHGVIKLSNCGKLTFTLPYFSNYNYMDLTTGLGDPGWALQMHVVDEVENSMDPGLSIAVPYTVHCRFKKGYELLVPINQAKSKRHVLGPAQKGVVSGALMTAKSVVDVVGQLPGAGAYAAVIGKGLSVASSVASILGFTKVQAERCPQRVVVSNGVNRSTVDGEVDCDIAALSSGNNVTIDPRVGGMGDADDTAFANLFPRRTLVKRFDWSPSATKYSTLAVIPVHPGFCYSGSPLTGLQPTVPGGIGMVFQYWSGSMEYEILVSAGNLMRGIMQVVWSEHFGAILGDCSGEVWSYNFDITAEDCKVLRIHWSSAHPALKHKLFNTSSSSDSNGFLHFRVAVPLSSPSSSGVGIAVLAGGGPDLQFSVPRTTHQNGTKPFRDSFFFSNQAMGDNMEECETIDLTAANQGPNLCAILGGDAVGSLRALAQKFSWVFTQDAHDGIPVGTSLVTTSFPFYPRPPCANGADGYWAEAGAPFVALSSWRFTWLGWASSFYSGIRGSVRVHIHTSENPYSPSRVTWLSLSQGSGEVPSNSVVGFANTTESVPGDEHMRTLHSDMPGAEIVGSSLLEQGITFTLPYYDRLKMISNMLAAETIPGAYDTSKWIRAEYVVYRSGSTYEGVNLHFFQAGGSDISLIGFLRVWPVSFRA